MSDRSVIALAVSIWIGAWWAPGVPSWMIVAALAFAAGAIVRNRALVLIVAGGLLSASLASLAWAGLSPPRESIAIDREVMLLSDPIEMPGGLRFDVAIGRTRAEASVQREHASSLRDRLAGERVMMKGRLVAPTPQDRHRLARRHVGARLKVTEVGRWREGGAISRFANGARRLLVDGSRTLDEHQRPLYNGFVLGDDRGQSQEIASDFRSAGLTHLLVVSGQNVAFVLVLARPLVSRLGLRGRWFATMLLLGFIIVITRAEPSVLRATAMAAVSATALERGRPMSSVRVLAQAVALVVLIDPLLVNAMGFQLSVAATLGIVLFAGRISTHLPGPRWFAELIAVTLGAQIGVAPIVVPVFDGLPVASLPANLLAVPAAAPLMMWGIVGGLLAGLLGPPFDQVLHVPTSLLLRWVAGVAEWSADLGLGRVESPHLIAIIALVCIAWRIRGESRFKSMAAAFVVGAVALVVAAPALWPTQRILTGVEAARGAVIWRDKMGAVVVVLDSPHPTRALDGLRALGVSRVDLLIARSGSSMTSVAIAVLRKRISVRAVIAPEGHKIRGASTMVVPSVLAVGDLEVVASDANGGVPTVRLERDPRRKDESQQAVAS